MGIKMEEKDIADKILAFVLKSKPKDCRYLTVKWLARNYGVSVPYLSAHFKKKHDMDLKDFLIGTKAMHGINLLTKKKKFKIEEIARILDFRSVHGFEKMFKRLYGITPHEYRVLATKKNKNIRKPQKQESKKSGKTGSRQL
jgi:YesN/AraC family two-component response regulator